MRTARPSAHRTLRAGRCARPAVLVDDDLGELLDRRLRRRLVEGDAAVLDEVDAITGRQHVHVVVQDHDHRYAALVLDARDEIEDERASLAPIAASGSSSSRMSASEFTVRA